MSTLLNDKAVLIEHLLCQGFSKVLISHHGQIVCHGARWHCFVLVYPDRIIVLTVVIWFILIHWMFGPEASVC